MRLGIMGGTFDPIHNAHLFIADAARLAASLERVLFIPSGNPPHKARLTPARDRFAMTQIAARPFPWAQVSRIEIDRQGTIYTVDTLALLREENPQDELFVIVGADALRDMPLWRDAARAMQMCTMIAVSRPGVPEEELLAAERFARDHTGAKVVLVRADSPDFSSSMIRERLAKGEAVDGLIPEGVAQYIREHGLYQ